MASLLKLLRVVAFPFLVGDTTELCINLSPFFLKFLVPGYLLTASALMPDKGLSLSLKREDEPFSRHIL